jgi:predicted nucleotidyltransferase component of viral defense system
MQSHPTTYPISLADLQAWSRQALCPTDEARRRYVQLAVLSSLAEATELALKGGNALRFLHQSTRSTYDLDFSDTSALDDNPAAVLDSLSRLARLVNARSPVRVKPQTVKRNPKLPHGTTPTYQCTLGFQLPGDRFYETFAQSHQLLKQVIHIEISLNEVVVEHGIQTIEGTTAHTRALSINDLLAEKLRAILQQSRKHRNRSRPQDVYDVAVVLLARPELVNISRVAQIFVKKCVARGVEPRRSSFDDEIRSRSSAHYDTLLRLDRGETPPAFDKCWRTVLEFVETLDIEP